MERITRANILALGIDWLLARPLCPLRFWSPSLINKENTSLVEGLNHCGSHKKLLSDLRSLLRIRKSLIISRSVINKAFLGIQLLSECGRYEKESSKELFRRPAFVHTHTFWIAWSKLLLLLRLLTSCTWALFTKHFITQIQELAFVDIHNDTKISICKSSVDAESWRTPGA